MVKPGRGGSRKGSGGRLGVSTRVEGFDRSAWPPASVVEARNSNVRPVRAKASSKAESGADKMVSTAVAKRDWFLKSADLATLPRSGGGAAWGVGRFPTYFSVKDLDQLALRVHGAVGFAKKKDARKRRLENKDKKMKEKHVAKKRRAPKPVRKEEEADVEEVEEEEFSGKRRASGSKRWTSDDVMDEVQDDDGDFKPGKEGRKKARKTIAKKEDKVVGKRPRPVASWTVDDVQDIDGDVKPPKMTKKKGKAQLNTVDAGNTLDERKQHNLTAAGKWDVLDCGDCYWLELWPRGNGLGGEALVCDCDVDLSCNDLYGPEMDFKAIFKTEKGKYVGVMTIRQNQNDTLSIEYFNGARGIARVEFTATAQKRKAKK
jgi:hypothetical protein